MPFNGTRQDVSNIVLQVIRGFHGKPNIVEATTFGQDLIVDAKTRRNYASLILQRFDQVFPGSGPSNFGPDDCANAGTVGDIVDAIWNEVNPEA